MNCTIPHIRKPIPQTATPYPLSNAKMIYPSASQPVTVQLNIRKTIPDITKITIGIKRIILDLVLKHKSNCNNSIANKTAMNAIFLSASMNVKCVIMPP